MRLLFVAEAVPGSRSAQRLDALRALGHAVTFVPTSPPGMTCEQRSSLFYRVAYRLRLPPDIARVNDTLIGLDASSFDLALFDNARTLRCSSLAALKAGNPAMILVWFSEDDMMNPRHRTLWIEKAIPMFNLWVTTKSFNALPEELPALGARRVLFVNNGYDSGRHRPIMPEAGDRARFGADIGFIGSFESPRARSLLFLAEQGFRCRVWGNGWGGLVGRHPNLQVEGYPLYEEDYTRALCSIRINLCFLRHFNRDRQTTRSIEIPACGGFMLHEHSDEMARLLRPEREAAYFATDQELAAACRRWLADPAGREAVAAAGLERVRALGLEHHRQLAHILEMARARN